MLLNVIITQMKNPFKVYKELYHISPLDLADPSETNRIHSNYVSIAFFIFGITGLAAFCIKYPDNLQEHFYSILYFSIFTVISLFTFFHSICSKHIAREKAYIVKNISFYLLFSCGIFSSLYNFMILRQYYNGVLTLFLVFIIALSSFYISTIIFCIAAVAGLGPMLPEIFNNFGLTGLMNTILITGIFIFLAHYKRSTEKKLILKLKKQKKNLFAKTFGNFTFLYENKVVKFQRSKSIELIAYLIYKNGSSVQTKELLTVLYGEHADSSRYGANLRNLISDIKHTLSDLEIRNFFITEYNNFRINPEVVHCDYYDFLAGDSSAIKAFAGEFMSQYSWAESEVSFLEKKVQK